MSKTPGAASKPLCAPEKPMDDLSTWRPLCSFPIFSYSYFLAVSYVIRISLIAFIPAVFFYLYLTFTSVFVRLNACSLFLVVILFGILIIFYWLLFSQCTSFFVFFWFAFISTFLLIACHPHSRPSCFILSELFTFFHFFNLLYSNETTNEITVRPSVCLSISHNSSTQKQQMLSN